MAEYDEVGPEVILGQDAMTPDAGMVEQEDGSVMIPDEMMEDAAQPQLPFNGNLAAILSPQKLALIGSELCELIEQDKESRKKRDEQYAEGIRRTGLGKDAPGGADFEGASKTVHPVMAEACVDYSASTIKEVFPPDGPVKTHFITNSDANTQMIELAEAKRDYYNWQLTKQMPEYQCELEILFTQQPLGGSQYLKLWQDPAKRRPTCEFVPVDKVHLPFSASSFYSSPRATLEIDLNRFEFDRRVQSGMYIDVDSQYYSFPEETDSQKATNKIEGKEEPALNEDGSRCLYEVYANYDVEGNGELPYIITVDAYSQKPVAIYRNWEENDVLLQKMDWVVEFKFIPWRGAYGVGLPHLIGGLSAAATGALRALLDSAHIQNFPGALKLKGARSTGQNIPVAPTEIVEIDAPSNVDDIRKVVMASPFPGPSPVLFQLLGFVVEAAKGVVSTAEEKISDASNQMPVGTTMALIEQGSKVFSTIHARQHRAQAKVLEILDRINRQNYDPEVQMKAFGRVLVPIEAFAENNNICPVSDPNIFSESQRFAQIQGVQQLAGTMAQLPWNHLAIAQRTLRLMHVDNVNEILPSPPKPVSADPEQEIAAAMQGQQLLAQQQMDHMQHIQEELAFLLDPVFGAANPVIMNPGFGVIFGDIMAHWQFLRQSMKMQAQQQAFMLAQTGLMQQASQMTPDPEQAQMVVMQLLQQPQVQQQVRQQAMQAYQQSVQQMTPLVQQLQQADQLVKQKTPPPQLPPEVQGQIQIAQMETQRKTQADQAKLAADQAQEQRRAQAEAAEIQLDARSKQLDDQIKMMRTQQEAQQQQFDNMLAARGQQLEQAAAALAQQVEMQKNDADNRQHQMTEIAKNVDDNRTNLMLEQMRQEGLRDREEMTKKYEAFQAQLDRMLEAVIADQDAETKKEIEKTKAKAKPAAKPKAGE